MRPLIGLILSTRCSRGGRLAAAALSTSAPSAPDRWYAQGGLTFSCTACGGCCSGESGLVLFSREEGRRMAAKLGVGLAEFYARYAHRVPTNGVIDAPKAWALKEVKSAHGMDCALLQSGTRKCTVYADRPKQCSTYPLWAENVQTPQSWAEVQADCPGTARADGAPLDAELVESTLSYLERYWAVVEDEARDPAWRPGNA